MKKRWWQVLTVCICVFTLCLCAHFVPGGTVDIVDDPIALDEGLGTLIQQTDADINVIPDKYNTGAKGELTTVGLGAKVGGVSFKAATAGTSQRNTLDFAYNNTSLSGTVTLENLDFSDYPVWSYNENKLNKAINVVFNNCKFSFVSVGKEAGKISFEFNNCSIESFYGSNTTFNNCLFGRSYKDGLVPYQNVSVNDCFFTDMAGQKATSDSLHVDATQIYGVNGIDVTDVHYDNCRFEIPPVRYQGSSAVINACIMLQLEFSNAKDVSFTDCTLNGGGYSIYAWDKNKGYTFENVLFSGIRSGCAKSYGTLYPEVDASIVMQNFTTTDALYVGSVWKDSKGTHFSVTNDTNQERELVIITSSGKYEYSVPACAKGSEITTSMTYDDFPFDIDVVVPEDCKYAVCFDNTLVGCARQVRFVNWTAGNVYVEESVLEELTSGGDDVLLSGSCGKSAEFVLSKSGILTLSGEGETYDYHSTKLAPWSEYLIYIDKIIVEEGVEALGNQIFRNCVSVEEVTLPTTLTSIGQRAFAGCSGLDEITIPSSVTCFGDAVFSGTSVKPIYYEVASLDSIEVGAQNDVLEANVVFTVQETVSAEPEVVQFGTCGKSVEYCLTSDGVLLLVGTGGTYDYHSGKTAPWYDNRITITKIIVEEGITKLGNQLFTKSGDVDCVELPESLVQVGKNCFHATNVGKTVYYGTEEQWDAITVMANNSSIKNSVCFE